MGRWAIINAVLGVIVLLLGIEIVRTWARSLPPVEVAAKPPTPTKPSATPEKGGSKGKRGTDKAAAAQSPAVLVTAIVDRDLFDPSRSKPSEEAKAIVPVERKTEPPPGVTVVGIRIVGRDREAFVTDASQGTAQRRLHLGDQIGGYTVKSIDVDALHLVSPSNDAVTMPLNVEKKAGGPSGPAIAKPPPPRPGQPGPAGSSPSAGVQASSPAAGVGGVKPVGPPAAVGQPVPQPQPGAPGQPGAVPSVQDRMQQLRERQLGRPRKQ